MMVDITISGIMILGVIHLAEMGVVIHLEEAQVIHSHMMMDHTQFTKLRESLGEF